MLCGIYGILPQVALWGKGKLCLKGTTQALMTHRSLQTFHENRKKTVVSREDKRVAEMRIISFTFWETRQFSSRWHLLCKATNPDMRHFVYILVYAFFSIASIQQAPFYSISIIYECGYIRVFCIIITCWAREPYISSTQFI